ncbi:MAG: AraC family transcriptional regulator [Bacteroidetes bacterium]|nr:MAG: AraC family transcriptional regulator [Bacteroidota bacterium]
MDHRVEKAILHISKHFRQNLDLENLASVAGLSKFHFQRLFNQEIGCSPAKYVNRIRLEHAAHFLIMYPEASQADVAFECGYSSPSVFARSFQGFYGLPPSQYQKSKAIQSMENNNVRKSDRIPIVYLNKRVIVASPSNLLETNIAKLYHSLEKLAEKRAYLYGVFLDAPFHKAPEESRYYAGPELGSEEKYKAAKVFEIEEGYYTYFDVCGPFQQLMERLVAFKEQIIDPSLYRIDSLVGHERIKIPSKENTGNSTIFRHPEPFLSRLPGNSKSCKIDVNLKALFCVRF